MADEMADAAADEMAGAGVEGNDELSENPLRDLIDEGCTAWDDEHDAGKAEDAFKRALALDPTSPDALCSMAVLLHESGQDLSKAAEHFAKSLEHSPEHVDTLHFYGNLLYSQQDDAAAELMYKRAVQVIESSMPDDPADVHPLYIDTLCNYGALLERVRHDIDGAQALYDKALGFDQNHRSVLYNYGVLLEDARKDYPAAQAMYRRALQEDPDDVEVLINLGLLLQHHLTDFMGAEECFERAIKVGSERADVHTNYGIFLEEIRRDLDAAEECYKRAVEADDTDVVALCHYGGVFLRQGKAREAETWFQKARLVNAAVAEPVINLRRLAAASAEPVPEHL